MNIEWKITRLILISLTNSRYPLNRKENEAAELTEQE